MRHAADLIYGSIDPEDWKDVDFGPRDAVDLIVASNGLPLVMQMIASNMWSRGARGEFREHGGGEPVFED